MFKSLHLSDNYQLVIKLTY